MFAARPRPEIIESRTRRAPVRSSAGIASSRGMYFGLATHRARKPGNAYSRITSRRTAASTSPGRPPRGHRDEQSLHWWQSQTSGSPSRRSRRPQAAQAISFRGRGRSGGDSAHVDEHVPHWKQFLNEGPA
jgi:hypothetical protein